MLKYVALASTLLQKANYPNDKYNIGDTFIYSKYTNSLFYMQYLIQNAADTVYIIKIVVSIRDGSHLSGPMVEPSLGV